MTVAELGGGRKPKAYFIDESDYLEVLGQGLSTHDEVRALLTSALLHRRPNLRHEVGEFLSTRFAHLIVDEVFDLNELDTQLLQIALDANLDITLVGDPWQSIFEWRGSTPKLVDALIAGSNFREFAVIASHRYRTAEMQSLAHVLVNGDSFSVAGAESRRRPDVVIADRGQSLWQTDTLPILPCGVGKVDKTRASAALVLLLNDYTTELFSVNAADLRNAMVALDWNPDRRQLQPARSAIADKSCDIADVWLALYEGLDRPQSWGSPQIRAGEYLQRMIELLRSDQELILGTSTHQAKGLEWPAVDYVTELRPDAVHRLDQGNAADRRKYVALTRAMDSVRVRPLPPKVANQMRYEKH